MFARLMALTFAFAVTAASAFALTPGQKEILLGHAGPSWVPQGASFACKTDTIDQCWIQGTGTVDWLTAWDSVSTPAFYYPCARDGLVHLTTANGKPYAPNCGGPLIEGAATNLALWSRDMTNAAWVKSNATVVAGRGWDGGATSASDVTATAGNATILQSITLASAARVYSIAIKAVTSTGTVSLTQDNSTYTALTSANCFNAAGVGTAINTSAFVRCFITATVLNPTVGIKIQNSGDEFYIDFNQLEVPPNGGNFATSPIATTSGTIARAASAVSTTKVTGSPAAGTFLASWVGEFALATVTNPMVLGTNNAGVVHPVLVLSSFGGIGSIRSSTQEANATFGSAALFKYTSCNSYGPLGGYNTINGFISSVNASFTGLNSFSSLTLGIAQGGGSTGGAAYGYIPLVAYWKSQLPEAVCQGYSRL